MPQRRRKRAQDLYKTEVLVDLDDTEEGDSCPQCGDSREAEGCEHDFHLLPAQILLRKLSPNDHSAALRKANAARAVLQIASRNRDSEEWLEAMGHVLDMGDEPGPLVDYLAAREVSQTLKKIQAEIGEGTNADGEDNEWARDGYLEGLRDSWEDGLADRYDADPDDPEASKVFAELQRFDAEVNERIEERVDDARAEFSTLPLDELRERVCALTLEYAADMEWARAFDRTLVFLASRRPDRPTEYYFESPAAFDESDERVIEQLLKAYRDMEVGVLEGKGSPPSPSSSPPSGPPDEEATPTSSGPEASAA